MNLRPLCGRAARGVLLAWVMSTSLQGWAAPADKPGPPSIKDAAEMALWWGDFDALERQNAVLRQPGHFDPDGSLQLEQFRNALVLVFENKEANAEPYLRELEALTLQWATEHPTSALAHTMHADALLAHAWSYRGGGYVNEVPPEAWREFKAYLMRAFEYLKAHADVAFTDSYAHDTLLRIGRGLGWNATQLEAIAQDGLKRNPEDYALYFKVMTSLLPKWGGDPKDLDKFIRRAAEQTRAAQGMAMYARLYSAAAEEQFEHELFQDSYADWALVKQGWEDLLARYPDSPGRRNRYAYMACLAKDRTTLLAQLDQLGPRVDARQWGANPQRSLEGCQHWARQQDAAQAAAPGRASMERVRKE